MFPPLQPQIHRPSGSAQGGPGRARGCGVDFFHHTYGYQHDPDALQPPIMTLVQIRPEMVPKIFTLTLRLLLQLESHNETKYFATLSPSLNRVCTWTKVMLEHFMTVEPKPAGPPCDLILKILLHRLARSPPQDRQNGKIRKSWQVPLGFSLGCEG